MGEELDPSKLKVVELRQELSARGLDTKGVKAVLVARLQEALNAEGDTSQASTNFEPSNVSELDTTTKSEKDDEAAATPVKKEPTPDVEMPEVSPQVKNGNTKKEVEEPVTSTPVKKEKSSPAKRKHTPEPPIIKEEPTPVKKEPTPKKVEQEPEEKQEPEEDEEPKSKKSRWSKTEPEAPEQEPEKNEFQPEAMIEDEENLEKIEEETEEKKEGDKDDKDDKEKEDRRESRGDKRRKSSPQRKSRERSPRKPDDEPEYDENKVLLSWLDSDLSLDIVKENFLSARPKPDIDLNGLWSGARGTYGVNKGKVCYEVKLLANTKTSDSVKDEKDPFLLRFGWSLPNTFMQLGEDVNSYGFDACGKKVSNKTFVTYGKTFAEGDVVGTYINLELDPIEINYTVNGENQGVAFQIPKSELPESYAFYPHIITKNISFEVNFGDREEGAFCTEITEKPEADRVDMVDPEPDIPEPTPQKRHFKDNGKGRRNNRHRRGDDDRRSDRRSNDEKKDEEGKKENKDEKDEEKTEEDKEKVEEDKPTEEGKEEEEKVVEETKEDEKPEEEAKEEEKTELNGDANGEEEQKEEESNEGEEKKEEEKVVEEKIVEKVLSVLSWEPLSNDYKFIATIPIEELVKGPTRVATREECDVIMMCGLPMSGKTYWVNEYVKENPDKHYNVLGPCQILQRMTINGKPRRSTRKQYLLDKCTKAFTKLIEIASYRRRNYILDQKNILPSGQRRKMRSFEGFQRRAVVILPSEEEYAKRQAKRTEIDGKDVPDIAVLEMKANMTLPEVGESFTEVLYPESDEATAKALVEKYNENGRRAGFGPQYKRRSFSNNRARDNWDHGRDRRSSQYGGKKGNDRRSSRFGDHRSGGGGHRDRHSGWGGSSGGGSRYGGGGGGGWGGRNSGGGGGRFGGMGGGGGGGSSSRQSYGGFGGGGYGGGSRSGGGGGGGGGSSRNSGYGSDRGSNRSSSQSGSRNRQSSSGGGGGGSSGGRGSGGDRRSSNWGGSSGGSQAQGWNQQGGNWNQQGWGGQGNWNNYGGGQGAAASGQMAQQQSWVNYPNYAQWGNYYGQYPQNWSASGQQGSNATTQQQMYSQYSQQWAQYAQQQAGYGSGASYTPTQTGGTKKAVEEKK